MASLSYVVDYDEILRELEHTEDDVCQSNVNFIDFLKTIVNIIYRYKPQK